jgi:hypothetical protein
LRKSLVLRLGLLGVALGLAGCGGSKPAAQTTTRSAARSTTVCHTTAEIHALAKLDRDLAALRAAGRIRVKDRLLGGPAVNRLTDRFLLDLAHAPISNLERNRLLDHAAAAVIANCQQCFQAFEAARPIPSIAHEHSGSGC